MQGPAESATCIRSHLLGLALEPVAVALKNDDLGVVNQAIDHRGDCHRITEDFGPRRKGLVGIQYQTRALAARADERKEQRRGLGIEGDVAEPPWIASPRGSEEDRAELSTISRDCVKGQPRPRCQGSPGAAQA